MSVFVIPTKDRAAGAGILLFPYWWGYFKIPAPAARSFVGMTKTASVEKFKQLLNVELQTTNIELFIATITHS